MATKKVVSAQEHHRRPRSLDGTEDPANKSLVPAKKHRAYHVIFGNMNAYQVRDAINYSKFIGKPDDMVVICKFINGKRVNKKGENNSKKTKKVVRAYQILFEGIDDFRDKIAYLNSTFLDPAYHFYIRKKAFK